MSDSTKVNGYTAYQCPLLTRTLGYSETLPSFAQDFIDVPLACEESASEYLDVPLAREDDRLGVLDQIEDASFSL